MTVAALDLDASLCKPPRVDGSADHLDANWLQCPADLPFRGF